MNEPRILSEPTIFGYNPKTGQFQGGGEAGDEVVSGKETLLSLIRSVVASENQAIIAALYECFENLMNFLSDAFPELSKPLVLDTGALVSEIAPAMDEELGKIFRKKGRE